MLNILDILVLVQQTTIICNFKSSVTPIQHTESIKSKYSSLAADFAGTALPYTAIINCHCHRGFLCVCEWENITNRPQQEFSWYSATIRVLNRSWKWSCGAQLPDRWARLSCWPPPLGHRPPRRLSQMVSSTKQYTPINSVMQQRGPSPG